MRFFLLLLGIVFGTRVWAIKPGSYSAKIGGLQIHYVVRGTGPVMIAGHPNSGKIAYELTLQPLEKYFTMVYYDPRGTGASEAPASLEKYNARYLVDEIEALRNQLKAKQVWLFGHSDQSTIALAYTLKYPQYSAGLILTGTSYTGTAAEMITRRKTTEAYRAAQSAWFAQVIKDWDYMQVCGTSVDSLGRDLSLAPVKWWCYDAVSAQKVIPVALEVAKAGRRKPVNGRFWQAGAEEIKIYLDWQKRFEEIKVPTLILNGKYDTNNPPEYVEQLSNSLPNAKLVLIEEAGHFPWVEAPDPFFSAIKHWLES
ncbi:MAG: alpha/beta hydrolase [Sphingobacteriales bacterium]|nr:MAG: alpha/beta hydrolase [Sphingobacteriales bacterium]